jgi:predicted short-subunit dehydrogenase-like oxidoreductase (DUF2520 family)
VEKIVLIGAGNVGYHLGRRLVERGIELRQVFSRTIEHARKLSRQTGVAFTTKLQDIDDGGSLYILAVPDAVIGEVARVLCKKKWSDTLFVHTSGATPSGVLKPYFSHYGVFYPLQTFSASREIDFSKVPICVDAPHPEDKDRLYALGAQLSEQVYRIDDRQRSVLHVAAVFVNNFTNALFEVGHDILQKEDLSFDLLRPLILETAEKVQKHSPGQMQTGPAIRGDQNTIDRHLAYLEMFPDYRRLYQTLTRHINPEIRID